MICCNLRRQQSARSLTLVSTIIRALLPLERAKPYTLLFLSILFHSIQSSFSCSNIIRYLNLAARPAETARKAFFSMRRFQSYDNMFKNSLMRREELGECEIDK
jgi:hypothetical protein